MSSTTFDFPLLPIGPGVTAVQLFESAAALSAEDDDAAERSDPRFDERTASHPTITSLQSRLLEPAGRPVRLGRYEVRRCIGSGGMGIVFDAIDVEHGQRVALKTLRALTGPALHRFKNEFRSLAGVVHENLVALHELAVEGDEWFFTMEYVEGTSFIEHVQGTCTPSASAYLGETLDDEGVPPPAPARRRDESRGGEPLAGPAFHEGRLRAGLRGLATGVAALHALGKLHRDINSANVLVTPEGRVVVLDFGLISDGPRRRPAGAYDGISGTPGFMSPEQAAGKPATPASDWYGVGVMLFEALTGQLPFQGSVTRMLRNKQREDAPPPSSRRTGVPADLEELCAALLERRPDRRPGADEILRRLGVERSRSFARGGDATAHFFAGRREELAALESAYRDAAAGAPVRVLVQGPAGIGKSALIGLFVEGVAEREGAVVLRGACSARETIPHRALDALVDALALHLRGLPIAEARALLPASARELVRLFPVLEGVDAIVELPPRARPIDDAGELERTAFEALGELLRRLAAARPLVLWIDDLAQGAPGEVRRISALLAPAGEEGARAPLLVLGCESERAGALVAELAGGAGSLRAMRLGPLAPADALALAHHALARAGSAPEAAEELARASEGSPYLVEELARWIAEDGAAVACGVSFERLVAARLERLPDAARRLVEVLAAVGRPIEQGIALAAARVGPEADATVLLLAASRLARARGIRAADLIEMHDERLRAAVAARIPAAVLRGIHVDVARALAARPGFDAELVAECFHRGGAIDAAAEHAAAAAQRAAEGRDFERAVLLYERALGWRPSSPAARRSLSLRRAVALADAGRGAEAARAFLAVAEGAPPGEALDLRRRAAEHLLVAGRVEEGIGVLRAVLDAHGIRYPETPRRAILVLATRFLLLRLRGTALPAPADRPIPAAELGRIDAAWSAGKGLSSIDPIRSAVFMMDALLGALESGDLGRVARGLAFVGCLLVYDGSAAQEDRGNELIEEASRIARRTGDPYLMGLTWSCSGLARMCAGRWREALARLDEGRAELEARCTGVAWERNAYRSLSAQSLFALGALRERTRRAEAWLGEARARGDRHGEVEAALAAALGRLTAGDAATARVEVRDAVARAWRGGFALQHHAALWLETSSYLYEGRASAAWEHLAETWPALDASQLLRIQLVRIDAVLLRGVTAVALAGGPRSRAGELLRRADADAARLARERRPHARAAASLVRAGTSRARGDRQRALEHLRAAALGYEAIEMSVHAACARRAEGVLLGGAEGAALVTQADEALRAEGIADPERWAQMYTGLLR